MVTARFNANGGSGTMAPQAKKYDTLANLSTNSFTRSGYTFSGWNTAADASGTSFSNGQRVRFKGSVTLYAQWTINAYTITFNANGGSGAMAPQTENYDVSANLATNTFTMSGYTFSGWNTAADGSGTSYADAQLVTFSVSTTLYAQWTINAYTITFNANGGSGAMASQTENYDVSANLSTNTFTMSGYTFSGWNTAADGSGTSYADAQLVTFSVSTTLYAQWIRATPVPAAHDSTNWAGYVVPSSASIVTNAGGNWVVPTLNCADTPNGQVAVWIGTGGSTGSSTDALLQTGISASCANGAQQDYAWWEIVPATPNYEQIFNNFTVSPGDQMQCAVFQTTSGAWETKLSDVNTGLSAYMTTGQSWGVGPTSSGSFSVQGSAAGFSYAGSYSAEWIVEDETSSATQTVVPFANFGSVTFSNLTSSLTAWSLVQSETWAIVQSGVTLATPTTTTTDGFSVGYTGP
ncbi:MAG TPA: G1 family glutamic endopeptidase [Acidimicrobiales bacterium]|nr:G1 family glutamic endopeptidase [Acidimicrobiales bacterium]